MKGSNRGISPGPSAQPHAHRANSTDKKGHADGEGDDDDDSSSVSSSELDNDKAEWALDEAAEELDRPPPSYEEAAAATPASQEEVVRAFLAEHKLAVTPSLVLKPSPVP